MDNWTLIKERFVLNVRIFHINEYAQFSPSYVRCMQRIPNTGQGNFFHDTSEKRLSREFTPLTCPIHVSIFFLKQRKFPYSSSLSAYHKYLLNTLQNYIKNTEELFRT